MENASDTNFIAERHDVRPAMEARRVSRVEFRPGEGQTPRAAKIGVYSRIDVRIGMRKLKRDAGVSHHTFENILRNEFVGIRAFAELAWILERSRSPFVRLYTSRNGDLCRRSDERCRWSVRARHQAAAS